MLVRVSFSSGSELDTEHVDLDRRSNRIHSVVPSNGAYCTPGPAPHRALDFRYVQCDLVRKANFERQSDSLWARDPSSWAKWKVWRIELTKRPREKLKYSLSYP